MSRTDAMVWGRREGTGFSEIMLSLSSKVWAANIILSISRSLEYF